MHIASYKKERFNEYYLKGVDNARSNTLGFIFMRLRIARLMTRGRASLMCGVSEKYMREFESGDRLASVKVCLKLGGEFGCNPEWVKVKWVRERMAIFEEKIKRALGVVI